MKFGVVVFPGTWSDRDCGWVVDQVLGEELRYLWHKDPDLYDSDCVILPGGFSYGDHLRCGAVARFSPIMSSVVEFAGRGGLVWGICNGFQILCEAGLLPGALIRNESLEFRCQWTDLRVERTDLAWTRGLQRAEVIRAPISHGEGNYFADEQTLDRLEANHQVVFRYTDANGEITIGSNPNGSARAIAGIVNEAGNVLGMMPHPERCAEEDLGGADGLRLFLSLVGAGDRVAIHR